MRKNIKKAIALLALLTPFFAFAQTIQGIITIIDGIVRSALPILIVIAIIVFVWGIIRYILAGGDEEKRKTAIHLITYGIIGLFVMVAIWGIVNVIGSTFGLQPGTPPPPGPGIPLFPSGSIPSGSSPVGPGAPPGYLGI